MIKFLPQAVKAQLRSGIAICSLQQCVEELVLNSIDAGATCVAVKVDIEACKLQVVDNGSGIERQDLDRVGNRYNTSKCSCLEDLESLRFHGYRGEAVASIISLSGMTEISSRTKLSSKTFVKVFNNGQSVGIFEAEAVRPAAGTTVTVCNFFYNMPVRKKHCDPVLEMERIRQRVEAISLMHPSVSFTVKKECTGAMLVQLPKVRSTYYRFAQIHGLGKAQKLCEVKHLYGQFEITGHIGREGHHTSNLQYLFLNGRLLLKTRIHNLLKCIFSKCAAFNKQFGSPCVSQVASSPKERAEPYGMYVINILCSYSEYDVCLEPAKTLVEFKDWDSLLYCVEECVRTFLTRESLLEITPDDTQGCLILPQHGQQGASSDTGNGSQTICSEFVGGKTLASKAVLRCAAVDLTSTNEGSHVCDKDTTTEDEIDNKVEATTGTKLELTSENSLSPLLVSHPDLEHKQYDLSNSVSVNCEDTVNECMITSEPEYKELNENVSCNKLTLSPVASPLSKFRRMSEVENQSRDCSNHTAICSDTALAIKNDALPFVGRVVKHTDCIANKRRKVSVANKLSYLKQTRIERCNSTTESILDVIRNDTYNRKRWPQSSVENVNGEQVLDKTPLPPSSLNCVEDSLATSTHDSKTSENSQLFNSLLMPHHIDSSSSSFLTSSQPTTTVDLNPINTCFPSMNSPTDKFENYEEPLHPQSACLKGNHTDESPQGNWLVPNDCLAGRKVYINKVTGLSRRDAPSEEETDVSCVSDMADVDIEGITKIGFTSRSYPFQTKEVTPFVFKRRAERVLSTGIHDKVDPETTDTLSRLFSAWKNPVFIQPLDVALDVTSGVADQQPAQVHNAMLPYRFTKDMISSMKVIHQVDKKFLACLVDRGNQNIAFNNNPETSGASLLVLVDQHAAHERVRLEGLVAESYEDDPLDKGQKKLCSSIVSPPLEVDIRQEDLRLLRSCQPLLSSLGLDVEFPCSDKACVLLRKVPACFLERESTQSRRGRLSVVKSLVEEYLQEQIKLLHSTRRLQATLPLTVHNVLASQACHGAIKFNHSLRLEECHSLVRSLAACQLPFQCAHGRPSITPLVDLQQLDSEQQDASKPNLRRLRRMYKAWLIYGKTSSKG